MVRHLLSILFLHAIFIIYENSAAPNPQFYFTDHHSFFNPYFQQYSTSNFQKNATLVPSYDSRILGGQPIPTGLLPFMAGYLTPDRNNKRYLCGGTLITQNHVLTAAHCLTNPRVPLVPVGASVIINSVRFSTTPNTLPAPAVVRKIKSFKVHELFTRIPLTAPENERVPNAYDIAILTLDAPVTSIKPVKLADCDQDYEQIEGQRNGLATGWGITNPNDANSASKVLRGTVLDITTNAFCQTFNDATEPPIKSTQICAYWAPGGKSTCTGDSGGPLLMNGNEVTQVGIISYGPTICGGKGNGPNVMTRVSSFFDWINENTGVVLQQ